MQGVNRIVWTVVVAALVLLFVNLIALGSQRVTEAVNPRLERAREAVANITFTQSMTAQCHTLCRGCCTYSPQKKASAEQHCKQVMRNQRFQRNSSTVTCADAYTCKCERQSSFPFLNTYAVLFSVGDGQ